MREQLIALTKSTGDSKTGTSLMNSDNEKEPKPDRPKQERREYPIHDRRKRPRIPPTSTVKDKPASPNISHSQDPKSPDK